MEELEIILEKENDKEQEINLLEEEIKEVYPELEDIEITPMAEEQKITPTAYGFRNITVKRGVDSSDATATSEHILKDETAYVNNEKLVGTYVSPYNAVAETPSNTSSLKLNKIMKKIGTLDLTGIYGIYSMFEDCTALEEVEFENANSLTDIYKAFKGCSKLKKFPNMDLLNVYNASYAFSSCSSAEGEVEFLNTEKLKNVEYMFSGCSKLTKITLGDMPLLTSMYYLFQGCRGLIEVILGDTPNVTNTSYMFQYCSSLLSTPQIDTSGATNMSYMFQYCSGLLSASQIDTSKATNMSGMFHNCTKLTDVSELNGESCVAIASIFAGCSKLTNFDGIKDLGKAYTQKTTNYGSYTLSLQWSPLTEDSLIKILNKLYDLNLTYDVANGGTLYRQKIVIGSSNLNKLKATEEGLQAIADAEAKGWTVSTS